MVNRDRVKALFLDLININSPSKNERGVADYLINKLTSLGFDVEEDDAGSKIGGNTGNLMAFKKGSVEGAKALFFSCHMDTVEPTTSLKVIIEGDLIRTDGTTILGADDKAGIAAVVEGIQAVIESGKLHGDIQVLLDVSEEIGLLGAKYMDLNKIKADMGYVLDTSKPVLGITVSAPSHANLIIEITGKAAHAGMAPEEGVSAIIAASNAISKMKLGRIDIETTANVGVIEGGKARNIIPDRVMVKAEARSRNEDKLTRQIEYMSNLFIEEAEKMGAKARVEVEKEYFAFRWNQDDDIVKFAVKALERIGEKVSFQDGGGGSDANMFNSAGVPAVLIGVGYESPHSPDERVTVTDIEKSAKMVQSLIEVAAGAEG